MITTDMVLKVFRERLETLVESKKDIGKTQKQIAAGIGISEQAMSLYLGDASRLPRADMLMRIAAHFHVSVDYLLGRAKAKTPNKEQIRKRLGLTDEAIERLRQSCRGAGLSLPEGAYPSIISALLETKEGKEVLDSITRYVLADFSEAHGFDIENQKDIGGSFSHVHFRAGQATGFRHSGFFTSTEKLAVVFINDIPDMLKEFRRAIQSRENWAPYRPQDQPYPDHEVGMKQARKELKARLLKETVYSTVRMKGKHVNSKYRREATGQHIPGFSAELAQDLEEHRNRIRAEQLLAMAERGRKDVDSADSE